MSYSRKRSRGAQDAADRAYFATKRFNDIAPWSTAGAARMKRGHPFTTQMMGSFYRTATAEQKLNRRASGYTGRGLYSGRGGYLQDIGGEIGSLFGKKGRAIGRNIGSGVGSIIPYAGLAAKAYMGKGTYTSNNLVQGMGDSRPSMSITGGGDNQTMVITHKEYVQDVYGPENSEFTNNGLSINPGLATNMPWLAQLACNYEEYEFQQLVFEYHSTVDASAASNSNGATGTFIMATNYNPDAPNFYSKEVMMQYHGASSGRVTDDQVHGVECDTSKNAGSAIRFVRTGTPSSDQALKDFDLGKFQWAVTNIPSGFENQQIGELWVYYTVKLSKPRLYSGVYRALPYQATSAVSACSFGNIWQENTVGTAPYNVPIGDYQQVYPSIGSSELKASINWVTGPASPLASTCRITFPNFTTGSYEIDILIRSNDRAGWVLPPDGIATRDPVFSGNVTAVNDLAIGGKTTLQAATGSGGDVLITAAEGYTQMDNNFQVNDFGGTVGGTFSYVKTSTYIGKFRVNVAPATAGVDNVFSVPIPMDISPNYSDDYGVMLDVCTVIIKPYNTLGTTLLDRTVQLRDPSA